jgi:hypothetical protein
LCLRLPPNKMAVTLLFVFLTVAGLANGRTFRFSNQRPGTVWVGMQGNAGKGHPNNGGFQLDYGTAVSKEMECCVCGSLSASGNKLHRAYWGHHHTMMIVITSVINFLNKFLFLYLNTTNFKHSSLTNEIY